MLLVTGITGHTGKYFLQELINNNYKRPIRCIVRENSDASLLVNSGLNIEKAVGDLNDGEFINKAMIDVDTVMHIYNIHHSPVIVKAATKNGVKRAILVHTTGIYSKYKNASDSYKKTEKEIAELTKGPQCPTIITIIRPTMIYGDLCDRNMSKFIKIVDRFRLMPVINGGNSLIQPVNARDLGKAFYSILMSPEKTSGKAYNLSGSKPIKMIEVFRLISKYMKKKRCFISVPLGFSILMARVLKLLTLARFDYVEKVQRMGEDRSYSHKEATRDFGCNPMSFDEGIQIEVKQNLNR
jgi:uncharacterized protein YbjT (DUF2867 family)